jgi:hypothetical protein
MFFSFIYQRPFTSLFLCFGLHKYFSWKYPHEYNDIRTLFGYYLVYYFSKAQLVYFKIHPYIVKGLQAIFPEKPLVENFEFVKESTVLYSCSREEFTRLNSTTLPTDFDFILYSKPDPEVKCINKKMFYSLPITHDKVEKTDYQFVLTEVIIANECIKIDLLTNSENYFIVRNRIDRSFILYYLKKYHAFIFDKYSLEEIQNYKLNIIDHAIDVKELTKDSQIIFHKNTYEILETKKEFELDNKKISDSIFFAQELDEDEEDYTDLPDLIPIEEEEEKEDLPDLIPMEEEEEKEDLSDLIAVEEEKKEDLPELIPVNEEEEKEDLPELIPVNEEEEKEDLPELISVEEEQYPEKNT